MAPPPLKKWRVVARANLTRDVFETKLSRPDDFQFQAGQYLSIVIPGAGPGGRNLRRAYSIASSPEAREIELCWKIVEDGPGTTYLNTLHPGDEMDAQAPFGDFCLEHDQSLPAMFIGTGTGLAPLRSMVLSDEWRSKAPVSFLLGVRAEQDILYPELFDDRRPSCFQNQEHVKICLSRPSDGWHGFKGRVTDYIRSMKDWDFAKTHSYMCGSGAMLSSCSPYCAGNASAMAAAVAGNRGVADSTVSPGARRPTRYTSNADGSASLRRP